MGECHRKHITSQRRNVLFAILSGYILNNSENSTIKSHKHYYLKGYESIFRFQLPQTYEYQIDFFIAL